MSGDNPSGRQRLLLATGLALLVLLCFAALGIERRSLGSVRGDEGTYLAMTASLARDGDVLFRDEDEERLQSLQGEGLRALILQRTDSGISYSKPLFCALVATPFFALLGQPGLVVLNALAIGLALALVYLYLRRIGSTSEAALMIVTFAGTGALLPHVLWKTGDALQAALAAAGLVLCLGQLRAPAGEERGKGFLEHRGAPLVGGVLLGLLVSMRPPNALIALIPVAALLIAAEWKKLVSVILAIAVSLALVSGASRWLYGTVMPYKAERATFNSATGYPAGADAEQVKRQFEKGRATSSLELKVPFNPRVTAFASLYFLVGRHTGILVYFPAALLIVMTALRRPDRTSAAVLLGVAGLSLFYLLWLPFNYFGGGSFVGNRYFLVGYAALPLALRRMPRGRSVAAVWAMAVVVAASALVSVWKTRGLDRTSQSHAYAGLFRLLPYESTASDLEGSRDRYFGKDFVRAVDPFVEAGSWSFRLRSDRPAAEFELANLERDHRLRLLVHSMAPKLELVYSDWGQRVSVPLSRPYGSRGVVEIAPSSPLRYHPLWFRNPWDHGKPYFVRLFKLGLDAAEGGPVEATVRFLGEEEFPPRLFERTVLALEMPAEVEAGSSSRIEVRVRNESEGEWRSDRLFPVFFSYRLTPLGQPDAAATEGSRTPLPQPVRSGSVVANSMEIRWPDKPGLYQLKVDLVVEGVAWFEERNKAPLGFTEVRVVSGQEAVKE
jgi:pimeloyl-ACP methyl ester carboxylesterase